jgi:hypothetical protein
VTNKLHTPAYENGFGPNTDKLSHLLGFIGKGVRSYSAAISEKLEVAKAKIGGGVDQQKGLVAILQEAAEQISQFAGGLQIIHGLMPVLMVTIVEAYLKDVLIYAAEIDATLMKHSGQAVSYKDLLNAESLKEVLVELRGKWAKNFVDNGGPTGWVKRLTAMGARGYRPSTLKLMEALWGVRHLMVHPAGIVTSEFVRQHSHFQKKVGDRFIVANNHLKEWLAGIYDFVEVTDVYFVKRCAAKIEGR